MLRTLWVTALGACLLPALSLLAAEDPAKKAATDLLPPSTFAYFEIPATGKLIDLGKLTAKGPVLVRLTCGCSGCDKELAYYQKVHDAYKSQGLISLLVFKEPDEKMKKYAADKKLNMLYAVDPKGESWGTFQTKAMPANFLIDKGGKIVAQGPPLTIAECAASHTGAELKRLLGL